MPIYAYKCSDCGHEVELLQKLSDPPPTECPNCHRAALVKQVTAAGFQLKGSGWYVTDFRNNGAPKKETKADAKATEGTAEKSSSEAPAKVDAASAPAKDSGASTEAAAAPSPAPTPPPPSGTS